MTPTTLKSVESEQEVDFVDSAQSVSEEPDSGDGGSFYRDDTPFSLDTDHTCPSECEYEPSVYSVTSSIREDLLMNVHGRLVNNHSDVYHLPADDEEISRLDHQHLMVKALVRSNYLGPVKEVLAEEDGVQKSILDLGCGTGLWAYEMAKEFPHCEVVGVDLAPVQNGLTPPNCRIEVDDINLGLEHFYGAFNLVNARFITSGIKDYYGLVDHISKILRPGGLFLSMEAEFAVYDKDKNYLLPHELGHPKYSWVANYCHRLGKAMRMRMGHIDATQLLEGWLEDHYAFEAVESKDIWIPCGPWFPPNSRHADHLNFVGKLMQQDAMSLISAGRPLLLGAGMKEDEVEVLLRNAREEISEIKQQNLFRIHCVWARKSKDIPVSTPPT